MTMDLRQSFVYLCNTGNLLADRKRVADAFLAHGDDIIPVLAEAIISRSTAKSTTAKREVKVALELLGTRGVEAKRALTPGIVSLLRSNDGLKRRAGLELLSYADSSAELVDVLTELIEQYHTGTPTCSPFNTMSAKDAVLALQRWGELRPVRDRLVTAAEPLLDAWDTEVRNAAANVISTQGIIPRPSVWTPWLGSPLSDMSVRQIHSLGGVPRTAFDSTAPRLQVEKWRSWARSKAPSWTGKDDAGFEPTLPPAVAFFTRQIQWTKGSTFAAEDRDFPDRTVTISGASENLDWVERGKRRLLYVVAHCSLQYFYCLDLLDEKRDPPVWVMDHEGGRPWKKWASLTNWLYWLRLVPRLAKEPLECASAIQPAKPESNKLAM